MDLINVALTQSQQSWAEQAVQRRARRAKILLYEFGAVFFLLLSYFH